MTYLDLQVSYKKKREEKCAIRDIVLDAFLYSEGKDACPFTEA